MAAVSRERVEEPGGDPPPPPLFACGGLDASGGACGGLRTRCVMQPGCARARERALGGREAPFRQARPGKGAHAGARAAQTPDTTTTIADAPQPCPSGRLSSQRRSPAPLAFQQYLRAWSAVGEGKEACQRGRQRARRPRIPWNLPAASALPALVPRRASHPHRWCPASWTRGAHTVRTRKSSSWMHGRHEAAHAQHGRARTYHATRQMQRGPLSTKATQAPQPKRPKGPTRVYIEFGS
jgi:hypothetical protein